MKLKDFLKLIMDEEARIGLEIDDGKNSDDYLYAEFWHSDYIADAGDGMKYKDCEITGFSFWPPKDTDIDILIQIKL